jgi:hypothetical protein
MARSYLKVYFDFDERTDELNDSEKARLLLAMLRYAQTGEKPVLTGNERFLFSTFKGEIDRDIAVYNVKVTNGNLGGRPAKETENNLKEPKETETKPKETETAKKKTKEEDKDKDIKETVLTDSKEKAASLDRAFDKFWAVYPRHTAKQDAKKAFLKVSPDDSLLNTMLTAIQRQKQTDQWSDPRYIPHPATWLNGRRWEDEPQRPAQLKPGKVVSAAQYQQRDYDEDDLEARLGVNDIFKGAAG